MADRKRRVSDRSLENLKLGAITRKKDKERHNFTLLPESVKWLKATGNASDTIDALVEAAKSGGLSSKNTHDWKDDKPTISSDVYERISYLEKENEQLRSNLEQLKESERGLTEEVFRYQQDAVEAADILKAALKLKSNAGGAIKREIEKALPLIDDI